MCTLGNFGRARCLGQGTRHGIILSPSADLQLALRPGPASWVLCPIYIKEGPPVLIFGFHSVFLISQDTQKTVGAAHSSRGDVCLTNFKGLPEQGQQRPGWGRNLPDRGRVWSWPAGEALLDLDRKAW